MLRVKIKKLRAYSHSAVNLLSHSVSLSVSVRVCRFHSLSLWKQHHLLLNSCFKNGAPLTTFPFLSCHFVFAFSTHTALTSFGGAIHFLLFAFCHFYSIPFNSISLFRPFAFHNTERYSMFICAVCVCVNHRIFNLVLYQIDTKFHAHIYINGISVRLIHCI